MIARGLSDRCSGRVGFHPADLSVGTITSVLKHITYFLHIHSRELFLKIRNAVQRVASFRSHATGAEAIVFGENMRETAIVTENLASALKFSIETG